jgi:hypothetical protein
VRIAVLSIARIFIHIIFHRRSLTDNENLEARSEAVLGDYLAAREELEEQYGREITHNERRELFEALEERDPELFSLFGRAPLNFGGAK